MTIAQEIGSKFTTLSGYLTDIRNALTSKTGTSHAATPLGSFASTITNISSSTGTPIWVRPTDWMAMPAINDADQKCQLIYSINPQMTYASVTCAGNYTVDWGDGVTENFNTGVNAQHTYDFNDVDITTVLSNGDKQVLITITPQAGANLTSISLTSVHAAFPTKSWVSGANDLSVNCEFLTTLDMYSATAARSKLYNLQSVSLNKNVIVNMSNLFLELYGLSNISKLVSTSANNMSNMFKKCYRLVKLPDFITTNVTDMNNMFNSCFSLTEIPLLDTANVTNFASMFTQCYSLRSIPLINTVKGQNMSSMFGTCTSLATIPLINTAAATNVSSMFTADLSLTYVPQLNISAVTSSVNLANMFNGCTYLQRARLVGTPYNISYLNCNLYRDGLVEIFTGLPTISNGSSITITGNPGVSSLTADDNLIATSKGWTIITA